ncbi:MAG TPA: anti-sigma factor [Acidobacteriota bacterium]|nr:anti-sigma factor [Acidobacteriota bacterium]
MSMRRLEELLILRASQGLSLAQQRELDELLRDAPGEFDAQEYEYAAAAVEMAFNEGQELPPSLRRKIAAQGQRVLAQKQEPARAAEASPQPQEVSSWVTWGGWLAAAVVLLAFLLLFQDQIFEGSPQGRDWAELRQELLDEAGDVILVPWSATEDEASLPEASGDVVWSNSRQEGYIRISGLRPNDPSRSQYQFWIFDQLRDQRFPVSGGVFDMPAQQDEIILPIRNWLRVYQPGMFAVTVEQPGGVMVSDRSRIALLAQRQP